MLLTPTPTPALQRVIPIPRIPGEYCSPNQAALLERGLDSTTWAFPRCPDPIAATPKVMVHDGIRATWADLERVEVPESTVHETTGNDQWIGVSYPEIARAAVDIYSAILDAPCRSADFVLAGNKWGAPGDHQNHPYKGAQLFGSMSWTHPNGSGTDFGLVLRSSLNQSLGIAAAHGTSTMNCANLQMYGDNMLSCKQTMMVGSSALDMLVQQALDVRRVYAEMVERMERYAGVRCTPQLFFGVLGQLQHNGLITGAMANLARRYWLRSHSDSRGTVGRFSVDERIEEHGQGTLESALQALTGGLHLAQPSRGFHQHASVVTVLDGVAEGRLGDDLEYTIAEAQAFEIAEA